MYHFNPFRHLDLFSYVVIIVAISAGETNKQRQQQNNNTFALIQPGNVFCCCCSCYSCGLWLFLLAQVFCPEIRWPCCRPTYDEVVEWNKSFESLMNSKCTLSAIASVNMLLPLSFFNFSALISRGSFVQRRFCNFCSFFRWKSHVH